MKIMMVLGIVALFALGAEVTPVRAAGGVIVSDQMIEHGGGCRKSSPPGQCCHMDTKAGSVHCH